MVVPRLPGARCPSQPEPTGGLAAWTTENLKVKKPSKSDLEVVSIPAFESPLDSQIYTVTVGAVLVASLRDMMLAGLREVSPGEYAKVRAAEFAAIKKGSVPMLHEAFILLVTLAAKMIPAEGAEHPLIRKARHTLTDLIEVLSPEAHAEYRAVKYAGSQDGGEGKAPKADPAKRTEALANVAVVVAKALLVPGF